jgi:hypothetical protein
LAFDKRKAIWISYYRDGESSKASKIVETKKSLNGMELKLLLMGKFIHSGTLKRLTDMYVC